MPILDKAGKEVYNRATKRARQRGSDAKSEVEGTAF